MNGRYRRQDRYKVYETHASVGNVTTGVDDLHSYTLAADQLAVDGDALDFEFVFAFAANANSKEVILKFGTTTIYDSTAQVQNGGVLLLKGRVTRATATTQRIAIDVQSLAAVTLFPAGPQYTTAAETLSSALAFKATGEAVATNDIVNTVSRVQLAPAA